MKKTIIMAAMGFFALAASAQVAHISGKFQDLDMKVARPFLSNATTMQNDYTTGKFNADGSFDFDLPCPYPTRYYLVLEEPHAGVMFYVEPGMKIDMQISLREVHENNMDRTVCDVVYTGDNKDCYDYIQNASFSYIMNDIVSRYYGKNDTTLTFSKFREEFRYAVDKAESDFANVGTTAFRKYMRDDYEKKYLASLSWFEDLATKSDSAYDAFMNSKSHDDPEDMETALDYASYVKKFLIPAGEDKTMYFLRNIKKFYSNEKVISAVASRTVSSQLRHAPANLEDIYAEYKNIVGTPTAAMDSLYNHYRTFVPGAPGINFTMTDSKGKKVNFAQLKGKAVYFDMWATWCGPCCVQIPYMEKLAEHYKNDKRIQIISVSLDANQNAWKKKIAKDKPQWPQYIMPDNFESDLCKAYEIKGIPRFMMFDKDGNVISIDAPRPSTDNIIEWIESHLK